jgi:iron(III) transport system permease protein
MARPALAAGTALAMMEVLADFGAVHFLSVQTLTPGMVRAWSVYGSTVSAARFALPLLAAAALLLWLERARPQGPHTRERPGRWRHGAAAAAVLAGLLATAYCLFLSAPGCCCRSAGWHGTWRKFARLGRLAAALRNSLLLATGGAVLTVLLATMLALGTRRLPLAARLASLGYATPGAVMAIGLLAPAGVIWSLAPGFGHGHCDGCCCWPMLRG